MVGLHVEDHGSALGKKEGLCLVALLTCFGVRKIRIECSHVI